MKNQTTRLLGLVLIGILSIPRAVMASDGVWGSIGLNEMDTTFSPGGGMDSSKAGARMGTATLGYNQFFFNVSLTSEENYTVSSYIVNHNQSTFILGYLITPEISLAIGRKHEMDRYSINGSSFYDPEYAYNIIASSYDHRFADTPFSINGSISYGKRSVTAQDGALSGTPFTSDTGTLSGSSTNLSYEIGAGYSLNQTIKFNLGYIVEQYDELFPTNVSGNTLTFAMQKIKVSGPFAGIAFAF